MQNIKEKMLQFDEELLKYLSEFGFTKKRRHYFARKINDCIQHISIVETKKKREDKVHISISVGFTYEKINEIISFIQDEKYDARWATASINIGSLMNINVPYCFFMENETDMCPIVQNILLNIKKYAFDFWEGCDTLAKYEDKLLSKDKNVVRSTYTLKRPEWNLLALSLLLKNISVKQIYGEYELDLKKK